MTKKTENQKLNEKIIRLEGQISTLNEIVARKDTKIEGLDEDLIHQRSKNKRQSKERDDLTEVNSMLTSSLQVTERKLQRALGYIDALTEDKAIDQALYEDHQHRPPMRAPIGPKIHDIHDESRSGRIGGGFGNNFESRGY